MLVGQGVCDEVCASSLAHVVLAPRLTSHAVHQQCNNAACYHDGGDCKTKPVLRCPSTSSTLECSGHGVCHTTRSNGDDDDDILGRRHLGTQSVCHCESGYTGEDCTTQVAKCFAPTTAKQPSTKPILPCSGYGECSSYGCNCQPGHLGEHCEIVASTCPLGDNGKVCSGHGVCRGEVRCRTRLVGCLQCSATICAVTWLSVGVCRGLGLHTASASSRSATRRSA